MRIRFPLRQLLLTLGALFALALAGLAPFAGTPAHAADAPMAQLRLLHGVAGAPAVDVYVDSLRTFSGASFSDFSSYETLAPGRHLVRVFATSANGTGRPVLRTYVSVQTSRLYTLALGGSAAQPRALLVPDNATPPTKGMARVRVVHLSADTPAVDVAIKGGAVLFAGARYGSVSPYLEVAPATADIQIRPAGWPVVARTVPAVALVAGSNYTFYAVGSLLGADPLRILEDTQPTLAMVRIVHAIPGAPAVDVYVDGQRIFTRASYGDISTYEGVAGGTRHIQVFPSGTFANLVVPTGKGLIDVMQALTAGTDYTIVASLTAGKPAAVALTDDNTAPDKGMVKVRVVHLSPDGPAVDVAAVLGARTVPLATAVTYQSASAPVEVAPGDYKSVAVMATNTTAAVVQTSDVTLAADGVYTVFVFGKVKGTPALSVVVNQDQ